jgi:protein-tyrosine-phosphatase
MDSAAPRLAFVCVQNAGRSQMAAAFARRAADRREAAGCASGRTDQREGRHASRGGATREADARGLDVEVLTGGTDPADAVHPEVVDAMAEVGFDLSDSQPREIDTAELETCRLVATMGCSTLELDADVDVRDWALPDPHGEDRERVREIRDEVESRVERVFDDLEADVAAPDPPAETDSV